MSQLLVNSRFYQLICTLWLKLCMSQAISQCSHHYSYKRCGNKDVLVLQCIHFNISLLNPNPNPNPSLSQFKFMLIYAILHIFKQYVSLLQDDCPQVRNRTEVLKLAHMLMATRTGFCSVGKYYTEDVLVVKGAFIIIIIFFFTCNL